MQLLPRKVACFFYRIYDWLKQVPPITWIFYRDGVYTHYDDMMVVGKVTKVTGGSQDGDWCFDIETLGGGVNPPVTWHCEITPCYRIPSGTLAELKPGVWVRVYGTRTYDPTHLGTPGHWEIHPVKSILVQP